jgi:hypothetical protein
VIQQQTRQDEHVVTFHDDVRSLIDRGAVDASASEDMFHTWPWFENLAQHGVGVNMKVRYALVERSDDQRAFVVPLYRVERGAASPFGAATSALSNFYSSLYGPIGAPALCTEQACRSLVRALRGSGLPHGVIELRPLDRDGAFYRNMQLALSAEGYFVDTHFCFGNLHLPCDGLSFERYFPSLPSRLKNTVKRARKKLDIAGTWHIVVGSEPGVGLEQLIADFTQIYNRSWKQREPFPEFVPGLCRMAAQQGWLRLGVLKLDGRPAAAQIWLVRERKVQIFKLAYDEAMSHMSPGSVLSMELFRRVLDEERAVDIDYLTGDDSYKRDWMTHRRERCGIVAYHPTTLSGLVGAVRHFGGRWVRSRQRASSPAPLGDHAGAAYCPVRPSRHAP